MGTLQGAYLCHIMYAVFSFSHTVTAESHSLFAFATYILGETQFPEFSVVLMLDDVQVAYYDSTERRAISTAAQTAEESYEFQRDAGLVFGDMYSGMKNRASHLKLHLNDTDGVYAHQRLSGCETSDHVLKFWDAFNGVQTEDFLYLGQSGFQITQQWRGWDDITLSHAKWILANVYHPICIKTLQRFLQREKTRVMRKVKPRVRVLRKTLPDSGGVQLSCLATGFYPRHINLTLFRDGQPVAEDQITGGMLLPNGDGTYQMRKSLKISAEELREKHSYTCTATHLSLDNKLDITFDADPAPPIMYIILSVLLLVCVCVILTITGFFMWRRAGSQKPHCTKYASPPSTDENQDFSSTASLN